LPSCSRVLKKPENLGSKRGALADELLSHPRKSQGSQKKGAVPPAVPADLTSTERKSLEELIARRLVVAPLEKAGVDAGVGIDAASAHRYVAQEKAHEEKATTSAHWGEDLAAWRRFAVEKTFPEIAAKIAQAATDDEGMTLGHAQVADDVGALGHAHPDWNDNDLAWQAFKRQNGDNKYADDALSFFKQVHAMPSP